MMKASMVASSRAQVFRKTAGMLSAPEAFRALSWLRSLRTPALDTVIRGILGYEDFTLGGRFQLSSLVKTELN